ncbi:MAG: YdeI/OmpD-associated family protein [Sphingomonas sp.]
MSKDPRVDAYIASKADFAKPILSHLRELIHARVPTVEEGIKWSMPFFSYGGRPLANMAAFKAHASFGFWNRQEMPTGKEGEAMGQLGRLTDLASMPPDAEIVAMIDDAVAVIDAGVKPARADRTPKPALEVPAALAEALANDEQASANWAAFPPGCRREYCEWVNGAKRDETRAKRVATTIAQTREGKRINWKYENC